MATPSSWDAAPVSEADVCVVGAGPAGLTLADALTRRGLTVLLLEAGPADVPAGGLDVTGTTSTGLPYAPAATRSAGVGGSALRWSVETPRGGRHVRLHELDDDDLDGSEDWPLSSADLAPFYARARQLTGLTPRGTEDGRPLGEGLEAREYVFAPAAVFTEQLPRELRDRSQVRLLTGCRVLEVVSSGEPATVTGFRCVHAGRRLLVRARAYVLAAGALENARLLLVSREQQPQGLGNGQDVVGRYFMEHPHVATGVVRVDRGLDAVLAPWDVRDDGGPRQTKLALPSWLRREHDLLNAAWKLKPGTVDGPVGLGHDGQASQASVDRWRDLRSADPPGPLSVLRRPGAVLPVVTDVAGHAVRRVLAADHRARDVLRVHVMAEQEPSRSSRLTLSDVPDEDGVPTADLHWQLTAHDQESAATAGRMVAARLGRLLGHEVVSLLGPEGFVDPEGGAHHIGTTRMGRDPALSVVDPHCRVHHVRNLWVAGSSVFPRSGAANPTLTLLALALRLGDRLADELPTR
ncbi:FAD-dependent oxidoreductase [Aquipuribacter sp. MA13-13]